VLKRWRAADFCALQKQVFEAFSSIRELRLVWSDGRYRSLLVRHGIVVHAAVFLMPPSRPAPASVWELFFRPELRIIQWPSEVVHGPDDPRSAAFSALLAIDETEIPLVSLEVPETIRDASALDSFGKWQNRLVRDLLESGAEATFEQLRRAEAGFQEQWAEHILERQEETAGHVRGWPMVGRPAPETESVETAALEAAVDAADGVTLDVFDTLLMRRVGRPTDVFWLLGREIEAAEGTPDADTFARLREEVENQKRLRLQAAAEAEDVSFDAIYEALASVLEWSPKQRDQWKNREVGLESMVLRPHRLGLKHLPLLGTKALVALSEMYLPEEVVGAALREQLGWDPPLVWTSGTRGISKGSGRLFAEAEASFGVPPDSLLHIGDNPASDGEAPRRRGWKTFAWPRLETSRLDRPEKWQPRNRISSVALGVVRAEREASHSLAEQVGFELLGPVVFAWLNHLATQPGIQESSRVWCLGRDTYWLEQIWRLMPSAYQPRGQLTYVPSSRQLWGLGAIDDLTGDDWDFLLKAAPAMTAADFVRRVGLDRNELRGTTDLPWDKILTGRHGYFDGADRDRLYELFVANIAPFHEQRTKRRERLLWSLMALNPLGESVAWVDLGWHGSSARAFDRLARQLKWKTPGGHYFASWREGQGALNAGARFGSFLTHLGQNPRHVALLWEGVALLENVFCAPTATVNDLDAEGRAVAHFLDPRTPEQLEILRQLWAGAERYCVSISELFPTPVAPGAWELAERALECWLRFPTKEEAALFLDWPHAEGWGLDRYHALLPNLGSTPSDAELLEGWETCGWRRGWLEYLGPELAERLRRLLQAA
jgi:FMN phosphatase YigB (HAD superfamily)